MDDKQDEKPTLHERIAAFEEAYARLDENIRGDDWVANKRYEYMVQTKVQEYLAVELLADGDALREKTDAIVAMQNLLNPDSEHNLLTAYERRIAYERKLLKRIKELEQKVEDMEKQNVHNQGMGYQQIELSMDTPVGAPRPPAIRLQHSLTVAELQKQLQTISKQFRADWETTQKRKGVVKKLTKKVATKWKNNKDSSPE